MWYCGSCGAQNPEEGFFCVNCGCPRAAGAPAAMPAAAPKKKKSKLPWIILAAVLVLALIAGCLWFFLWRTPHYRMISSTTISESSGTTIATYTYLPDGVNFTAEQRRDGELIGRGVGTIDKTGAITAVTWMNPDGSMFRRFEYENDKYGNHVVMRLYDAEGKLVQVTESEYNAYRVVVKQTSQGYRDGVLSETTYLEFSDENNGMRWRVHEDGSREPMQRIVRSFDDKHQNYQETQFHLDGSVGSYYSYVRDKDYNTLSYTYGTEYFTYNFTYQWEKIK